MEGGLGHLLGGQSLHLGDGLAHPVDIARVAPLAPEGLGGHVGGVGLYHDALQRNGSDDLQRPPGIFEGDVAGEGDHPAQACRHLGVLGGQGTAVKHPPGLGVGADNVHHVLVGVPVVDNGGQVQLLAEGELGVKEIPGVGPLLRGLEPVVVQTDLPHRHTLGVGAEGLDLLQIGQCGPLQILRVEPGGKVEEGVLLGQGLALPGGGEVAPRADHQLHPLFPQPGEHNLPVLVKPLIIIMGMCIE